MTQQLNLYVAKLTIEYKFLVNSFTSNTCQQKRFTMVFVLELNSLEHRCTKW